MLKATDYVRDNRAAAVAFIAREYQMDAAQAERAYEAMVWTRDGEVGPDALNASLDFIEQAANLGRDVPPEEVVDYALLREVRAELGR